MGQVQKIKFAAVEEFLDFLPAQERQMVQRLRGLIFQCLPEAKEKLSYNVPFYYLHSRICFIWPASVPWGNVPPHHVRLGFCQGPRLRDEINYLEKESRKQVYSKTFANSQEIDEDLLKAYLYEAVEVDQQLQAQKRENLF